MDLALRADGSSIRTRLRREVKERLGCEATQLTCVEIVPLPAEGRNKDTAPSSWAETKWYVHRYHKLPNWDKVQELTSTYSCHATEIARSTFQRPSVYNFVGVRSWSDLAIQVLRHIR